MAGRNPAGSPGATGQALIAVLEGAPRSH